MSSEDRNELSSAELDAVVGGKQHFKPEPEKIGWLQHKVTSTDTLIRIAKHYNIPDWTLIRTWNPHINPKTNLIVDGEYLWIKIY